MLCHVLSNFDPQMSLLATGLMLLSLRTAVCEIPIAENSDLSKNKITRKPVSKISVLRLYMANCYVVGTTGNML
jgi:hypothetical protein